MKRVTFISLFIFTHLFFIFFQINKHNQFIKLSYVKQKYENEIKDLMQKKQELAQNLYNLRKSSTIKQFARDKLNMCKVGIKQVKKIDLVQASVVQANTMAHSKEPQEPTSPATLRYTCLRKATAGTQGERGGGISSLVDVWKSSETVTELKLAMWQHLEETQTKLTKNNTKNTQGQP